MVKIRLKRTGRKKSPTYRIIVINSLARREGAPIEELGHYNPKTKEMKLNKVSTLEWIKKGAQPTETVSYLLKNCDENGNLIYTKKVEQKLSKKAVAKLEAEKKAKEDAKIKEKEAKAAAKLEEETKAKEEPVVENVIEETPAADVEAVEAAAPEAVAAAEPEKTVEE